MSILFVEPIAILFDTSMHFNYGFDFIFFILAHDRIVNWWSETLGRLDKHNKNCDWNFASKFRNNEVVSKYLPS